MPGDGGGHQFPDCGEVVIAFHQGHPARAAPPSDAHPAEQSSSAPVVRFVGIVPAVIFRYFLWRRVWLRRAEEVSVMWMRRLLVVVRGDQPT
jgi:hypothetical protein